jgi:Sec-independent protein translocase protein TatA
MLMIGEIFGMDALVVVIVLVVLLFGGAAIPKLARHLGSAKNEFETGLRSGKHDAPGAEADGSTPSSSSSVQSVSSLSAVQPSSHHDS